MKWFLENWYLILACLTIAAACIAVVINFLNLPTSAQIANFKEWLKWAVAKAEQELGGGTGQLKLRMVYEMAVGKFSWVKDVMPFERFSALVDEALEWLRDQLKTNAAVKSLIEKEEE